MLKVLTLDNCKEWDEIVSSFTNYDVYYLSGYVKAFKLHGDGEPILFYFYKGHTKGINVVMKRDISDDSNFKGMIGKGILFDISTPYGYGGWLIEGDEFDALFAEYEKWCCGNNIVSEFVRFHPVLENHKMVGDAYDIIPLGETVTIDISNNERIWNNFTPKNRNVIRKAINNGITIKHGLSNNLFDSFIAMYNKTMDKDNADNYYYFDNQFYDSIRNDLKNNSLIFYADYNGIVVSSAIVIFANGHLNYHLSGSLKEYQHLAPTNLLLWKASEWGFENGFSTFHLGGGLGSKEDGLFHFKKAFYRGELCRFYIGKKIFNKKVYNELVAMRISIGNPLFFPVYRG